MIVYQQTPNNIPHVFDMMMVLNIIMNGSTNSYLLFKYRRHSKPPDFNFDPAVGHPIIECAHEKL